MEEKHRLRIDLGLIKQMFHLIGYRVLADCLAKQSVNSLNPTNIFEYACINS